MIIHDHPWTMYDNSWNQLLILHQHNKISTRLNDKALSVNTNSSLIVLKPLSRVRELDNCVEYKAKHTRWSIFSVQCEYCWIKSSLHFIFNEIRVDVRDHLLTVCIEFLQNCPTESSFLHCFQKHRKSCIMGSVICINYQLYVKNS